MISGLGMDSLVSTCSLVFCGKYSNELKVFDLVPALTKASAVSGHDSWGLSFLSFLLFLTKKHFLIVSRQRCCIKIIFYGGENEFNCGRHGSGLSFWALNWCLLSSTILYYVLHWAFYFLPKSLTLQFLTWFFWSMKVVFSD